MRRWRRPGLRVALAAVVAVAALVAGSACSGGDDASTTTTDGPSTTRYVPPDEQALVAAARDYNRAQFETTIDEDVAATAHRFLTESCRAETSVTDLQVVLNEQLEQRRLDLGAAADELTVSQLTVADINTSVAQVLVTVVTPSDDDPLGWGVPMRQTWWVEGDGWRIDPCAESTTIDSGSDQFTPVSVLAAGFHHGEGGGRWSTNWAVIVRNPNLDAAAYDVEVQVDFVDAAGEIVETIEDSILAIEPGQSGALAAPADAADAVTLEVRATAGSWAPTDEPVVIEGSIARIQQLPLEPGQTVPTSEIVSTLTNTSEIDLGAIPVIVYVDAGGAVRGGAMEEFTNFGFIPAGGTKEWMAFRPDVPDDWTFRVYVTPTAPDYEWEQLMLDEGLEEQ